MATRPFRQTAFELPHSRRFESVQPALRPASGIGVVAPLRAIDIDQVHDFRHVGEFAHLQVRGQARRGNHRRVEVRFLRPLADHPAQTAFGEGAFRDAPPGKHADSRTKPAAAAHRYKRDPLAQPPEFGFDIRRDRFFGEAREPHAPSASELPEYVEVPDAVAFIRRERNPMREIEDPHA